MSESHDIFELVADDSGERLDKLLAGQLEDLSRSQIQTLIREGLVTVSGHQVKAAYRPGSGEHILVSVPLPEENDHPLPEAIPLDVVYEDEAAAVIDKPAGLVVHPAYGHLSGTLVNAVLARWPQTAVFGPVERAGIVHRLDKDTSGVILIAKTEAALEDLREQFKTRQVHKRYLALVEGIPDAPDGLIDAPIGRDPNQRKRMAIVHDGREAVTEYHVLETYAEHSLIEALPLTGRTHQIRVHMAFIGHPIVGDSVYGWRKQRIRITRHFLHATSITFVSPHTHETVTVEAPLPAALQDILDKLAR